MQTLLLFQSFACDGPAGLAEQPLRPRPVRSPAGQMQGTGLDQGLIGVVRQSGGGRQRGWVGGLKPEQLFSQLRLAICKVITGIGTGR